MTGCEFMQRLFLFVLVLISSTGFQTTTAADSAPLSTTKPTADKPVILILGDSLSAGYGIDSRDSWPALLQQRLAKNGHAYEVVNASVSGDTSRTGLSRLPDALAVHQPAIVVVELGANDGLRGIPFTEIESSLEKIVSLSQAAGARVLLTGIRLPTNYGPVYTQRFAQVFENVARKMRVPLVPQLLREVSDHRRLMQADGLHPIAAAQPRIVENLWPTLKTLLSTG